MPSTKQHFHRNQRLPIRMQQHLLSFLDVFFYLPVGLKKKESEREKKDKGKGLTFQFKYA